MNCRFRNAIGTCTVGCKEKEVQKGDRCIFLFVSEDDEFCPSHHGKWETVIFNEKFVADRITELLNRPCEE